MFGEPVPRGTLEIGVYEPPAASVPAQARYGSDPDWRAPDGGRFNGYHVPRYIVVAFGAFASLLVHVLVITALTWGGSHVKQPARQHPDEIGMELVSLDDDESIKAPTALDNIGELALSSITVDAAMADVTFSLPESGPSYADADDAEASTRSMLFGRYMGQIDARIQRAWFKPREVPKNGLFTCRVRIEQGPTGAVTEIVLERCNRDAAWQMSLVQAIQLASPLPAPPDPKVFTPVLHMEFRGEPVPPHAVAEVGKRSPSTN
jgi:TonB C terminal